MGWIRQSTQILYLEEMPRQKFKYEATEKFGESLTAFRPWNTSRLSIVEQINGRVAMVGFSAAVLGELITGKGMIQQLVGYVNWYLNLG